MVGLAPGKRIHKMMTDMEPSIGSNGYVIEILEENYSIDVTVKIVKIDLGAVKTDISVKI